MNYPNGLIELRKQTLNALIETSVQKFSQNRAVSMALEKPLTYAEFFNHIISIASILEKKGIGKGDKVAILGENSPNWGIAYLAAVRIGSVVVPILPDFPEADIHHILSDSQAKILFTTQKQVDKIAGSKNLQLQCVIMLDNFKVDNKFLQAEPFSDFVKKAVDFILSLPDKIGLRSRLVRGNDLASIIYTSGTSGHSKAVMLTHRNFISNVLAASTLIDIASDWTFLSILPLSHAYEFTLGFLLPLLKGARIVYVGKVPSPSIMEKICETEKPDVIPAVPLVMEKIYKKKVLATLEKKMLLRLALKIPVFRRRIHHAICQKLINFFGGQLKLMAIGGAAINLETEKFLRDSGFPYLIGYGLTETAPLLCGGPWGDQTIEIGSTGKPVPGVEIRIADPDCETGIGEILARGPNIMKGYYKNPQLTQEIIDGGGWLKTGDLGYFDRFGNLHIKGRSKNMILLANGENIYPEVIEDRLNSNVYVVESLVLENRGQLEALVYLDYDLLDAETKGKSERQRLDQIKEILDQIKDATNPQLSAFSKISRVVERKEPFEKTATQKIKRYLYIR